MTRLRWHRLVDARTGRQWLAGFDLASIVDMHWRLAQKGFETRIVSRWLPLPPGCTPPTPEPGP